MQDSKQIGPVYTNLCITCSGKPPLAIGLGRDAHVQKYVHAYIYNLCKSIRRHIYIYININVYGQSHPRRQEPRGKGAQGAWDNGACSHIDGACSHIVKYVFIVVAVHFVIQFNRKKYEY